jgi:hypothetical protein
MQEAMTSQFVIAGLDPAINPSAPKAFFRWMRGSSPRMTSHAFWELL